MRTLLMVGWVMMFAAVGSLALSLTADPPTGAVVGVVTAE